MESYIVRIYRRDERDRHKLSGLVEVAGSDEKRRFSSLDGLGAIMSPEKKAGKKGQGRAILQHKRQV